MIKVIAEAMVLLPLANNIPLFLIEVSKDLNLFIREVWVRDLIDDPYLVVRHQPTQKAKALPNF
jgi:hypothetical protein